MYHSPKWPPDNINGARLYIYTMQQRLIYQPGPTHAYETRWTCVATANPFWPLIVKPNMRVPSLDMGRAHKDTFGILVEMGPHKLLLKLVILSSASHLTPFYNHAHLHVKVWLSHLIIFQLPLKAPTSYYLSLSFNHISIAT